MKNRFTITLSDVNGVRHYTFDQLVKRFFLWGIAGIFVLLLVGGGIIYFLIKEVDALEQRRQQAIETYERTVQAQAVKLSRLRTQNATLSEKLDEKALQLQQLDLAVRALQDTLGADLADDLPIEDRVEKVTLTAKAARLMMHLVPNGRPLPQFAGVSSNFGWRKHPVTGAREFHKGLDYRGKTGDPIIATADGIVEYAGYHKASGYGKMIIIHHAFGFRTLFGHLSKVAVKSGQLVKKGQVIGYVGNTGLSTGSHLHYEISFVQRALNPVPFVLWSMQDPDDIFEKVRQVPWASLANRISVYLQDKALPSSQKDVPLKVSSAD